MRMTAFLTNAFNLIDGLDGLAAGAPSGFHEASMSGPLGPKSAAERSGRPLRRNVGGEGGELQMQPCDPQRPAIEILETVY